MNSKKAGIVLSAIMLIATPLVFTQAAEAKSGHKQTSGHHYNYGHRNHRGGQHNYGGHHYRPHHDYGHHYRPRHYPHYYDYDSSYAVGLHWPYGFSFFYRD